MNFTSILILAFTVLNCVAFGAWSISCFINHLNRSKSPVKSIFRLQGTWLLISILVYIVMLVGTFVSSPNGLVASYGSTFLVLDTLITVFLLCSYNTQRRCFDGSSYTFYPTSDIDIKEVENVTEVTIRGYIFENKIKFPVKFYTYNKQSVKENTENYSGKMAVRVDEICFLPLPISVSPVVKK